MEREHIERPDAADDDFHARVSRFEATQSHLNDAVEDLPTPEEYADHKRAIEDEAWFGLMESVEYGYLSMNDAESLFRRWFMKE